MTTHIILRETGVGEDKAIFIHIENKQPKLNDSIELKKADLDKFHTFQKNYQNRNKNKKDTSQQTLLKLGQDLYQWLNQRDWLKTIIASMPSPPWNVEFLLESPPESEFQKSFINLPWECLADEKGFLREDRG